MTQACRQGLPGLLCILAAVMATSAGRAAEIPAKPNVVLIMADDLGYGDLSCYGAKVIATPHCDRLAREGRRFTDAHAPSSSCSPTRFGLLTGCYPWRENRVPGALNANQSYVLREGEPTLASLLKGAGYATACVGKWHLGAQKQRPIDWSAPLTPGPNTAGFDSYFGVINSHNLAPFVLVENDKIVGLKPGDRIAIGGERIQTSGPRLRDEQVLEAQQAAKAVAFIEKSKDQPFFLYYPTAAVHDPYTPGKDRQGTSRAGVYGDYVQEFDWAVGEVLSALDRLKLTEKTIVIVTSDNGAQEGRGKAFGHKCNGDLRGFKGTAWEGGHRMPFLVRWPGKVPVGTTCDETICHVDMMATLAAALGIALPAHAAPDSFNVLPSWLGEKHAETLRGATVSMGHGANVFAVRQGSMVLLLNGKGNTQTKDSLAGPELYDLTADLPQRRNLAAAQSDKVKELTALLDRYREQGYSRPGWQAAK